MSIFRRFHLLAVFAWELCVVGFFGVYLAVTGGHTLSKADFVWIAGLAACGVVLVGAISITSRRFGRIGAGFVGLIWGLLPSAVLLSWVAVARPGFEASAGIAGFAYFLAPPSAVGGAVAGIICSVPHISRG